MRHDWLDDRAGQHIAGRWQKTAQPPSELNSPPPPMKEDLLMPVFNELLSGTCQQLRFSPKEGIGGALMKVKGAVPQLSMQADVGAAFARSTKSGKRLRVLAAADHSTKTKDGVHPVCLFEDFADAQGHPIEMACSDPANTTIRGRRRGAPLRALRPAEWGGAEDGRVHSHAPSRHGSGRPGLRHQGQRGQRSAHDGAGHASAGSARSQPHRTRLKQTLQ